MSVHADTCRHVFMAARLSHQNQKTPQMSLDWQRDQKTVNVHMMEGQGT